MNSRLSKFVSLAIVLLMAFSMAACTATTKPVSSAPSAETTGSVAASPEPAAEQPDSPLGKYDPEITITTIRPDLGTNYKYDEGETIDDNLWIRLYKDKLGINLKYDWVVSLDQYTQKFAVAVARTTCPICST